MKVTRIDNIELRDSPVKYRRVYTANALLAHAGSDEEVVPIEFTVEDTADRGKVLSLRFLDTPHYPLLPAQRAVREHLEALETRGEFV
ncbi:MAG: hypothetical protein R6W94_09515 [Spirochaetia bacterium]